MKQITCCFSGHRSIPDAERDLLIKRTRQAVNAAYYEGYRRFICGGAVGYDTICADTVLSLRQVHPDVKLILMLPCKGQDAKWREADREHYRQILSQCDECRCLNDSYTPTCMHERNRAMVNESSLLLAYLKNDRGGTAYTCSYAKGQRVHVVNLAPCRDSQLTFFNDGVIL